MVILVGVSVLGSTSAQAELFNYTLTGTLDNAFFASDISSSDDFGEVDLLGSTGSLGDNLFDRAFVLTFTLDDSLPISNDFGSSAIYNNAITDVSLTVEGAATASSATNSAFMADSISSQQQWSFQRAGTDTAPTLDENLGIDFFGPVPEGDNVFVDFTGIDVFLIDKDSGLFSNTPPELVAFNSDDFDDSGDFTIFQLTWDAGFDIIDPDTGSSDFLSLEITLDGTIESIVGGSAAVPLPATVWLFCSGLLGIAGLTRRKKA